MRGEEGVERKLLEFWVSFRLRNEIEDFKKNSAPYAIVDYPEYLKKSVEDIKEINRNDTTADHRQVYNQLISKNLTKGKLEENLNHLNWKNIWNNVAQLPNELKDLLFRINYDILPTNVRLKRTNRRAEDNCEDCGGDVETTIHVFLECICKKEQRQWLIQKAKQIGQPEVLPEKLLRLDLETNIIGKRSSLLVATYIQTIWENRKIKRRPSVRDLEEKWTKVIKATTKLFP